MREKKEQSAAEKLVYFLKKTQMIFDVNTLVEESWHKFAYLQVAYKRHHTCL
jgi:hypothetical protein